MSEERDIPTLEDLVNDIDAQIKRLDQTMGTPAGAASVTAQSVMEEIRNTVLPLLKDVVLSTSMGLAFVEDLARPVELSRDEADDTVVLLKAYAASRPTDPELQARISAAVEVLSDDDEGDEDGEETDPN